MTEKDKFRVVVKALITNQGDVLIGKKEEGDNPHSGEWHFLGGHVEEGEQLEEAVKREVEEETGLEVSVHQIIDAMTFPWVESQERDALQVLFHCESDSRDAEASDDLEDVEWVETGELEEKLWAVEAERLNSRDEISKFIEKLEKMPVF